MLDVMAVPDLPNIPVFAGDTFTWSPMKSDDNRFYGRLVVEQDDLKILEQKEKIAVAGNSEIRIFNWYTKAGTYLVFREEHSRAYAEFYTE